MILGGVRGDRPQNSIVGPTLARDSNDPGHTVNPVWIPRNSGDSMQVPPSKQGKSVEPT
jgi:hypothetical protein